MAGCSGDPVAEGLNSDQASIGKRQCGSGGAQHWMGSEREARRCFSLGRVGSGGVELAELRG